MAINGLSDSKIHLDESEEQEFIQKLRNNDVFSRVDHHSASVQNFN